MINLRTLLNFYNMDLNISNEIIDLFTNKGVSIKKLSKIYHFNQGTISNMLKSYGIKVVPHEIKINENIFDEINTEEKAYWLGFLYADGTISSHSPNKRLRYEIKLVLKYSDIVHLKKFNLFMEYQGINLKTTSQNSNLGIKWSISNKHLWETLNNLGCIPKKSLILKYPNINIFKNKNFIFDFIRGYNDGDGCISYSTYNNNVSPSISMVGTKNFLAGVQKTFGNIGHLYDNGKYCTFSIGSSKDIEKYFSLTYNNPSIYLDRKYNRAKFFMSGEKSLSKWQDFLIKEKELEKSILSNYPNI